MALLINVKNISKSFGRQEVFTNVSFEIHEGDTIAIMGPSGVGKTTLLKILAGLDTDYDGNITYHEKIYKDVVVPLPIVFQGNETLMPWLSVEDHLKLVNPHIKPSDLEDILESVGLYDHRVKKPDALSGGMKQRLAFARAMAVHSKVLFMDEAFSNLDKALKESLYDLMALIKIKRQLTIVMITHDEEEALTLGTRRLDLSPKHSSIIEYSSDLALKPI